MKLPQVFGQLLKPKTEPKKEQFLSLVLQVDYTQAALWEMDKKRGALVLGTHTSTLSVDTWEERTKAADEALSAITPSEDTTTYAVVFGLPKDYLTDDGDISPSVRAELKKLASMLQLKPVGFVPLTQALVYKINRDEGMPANVILIGVTGNTVTVTLYKIGNCIGQQQYPLGTQTLVQIVQEALRRFPDAEVLPSRMLLYGANLTRLEEARRELLKHAWQSKANFLHFPKIEQLSPDTVLEAVSLAGASELASALGEEPAVDQAPPVQTKQAPTEVALPPDESVNSKEPIHIHTAVEDSTPSEARAEFPPEGEPNVVLVDPQELGFGKKSSLLDETVSKHPAVHEHASGPVEEEIPIEEEEIVGGASRFAFSQKLHQWLSRVQPAGGGSRTSWKLPALPMGPILPLVGIFVMVIVLLGGLYWFVPAATVTVLQLAKPIEATMTITVDPTSTAADPAKKIIPGLKQEQSVSGDKVIAVTGKKEVGDPARGSVTIYNKSLSTKTFHKGSVLVANSLQFTLDDEISVASASESIGSITFGKANATITARAVGKDSNLSANTEFSFKDVSDSIAIARNEKPLSGGTSREVTVVSRADTDALVKDLSTQLVEKAKQQLSQSVTGGQQLIDATVKTQVTQKTFTEELDQEASQLHGNVTLTVSGIAYSTADLTALLEDAAKSQVSAGYTFSPNHAQVSLASVKVAKDGKITGVATYKGTSLPVLDTATIRRTITGKSLTQVQDYLKNTAGVAGVIFEFHRSLWTDRLPVNTNAITVRVSEP